MPFDPITRRQFSRLAMVNAFAAMACRPRHGSSGTITERNPFGSGGLVPTVNRPLELPPGFRCAVVQGVGDVMSCGNRAPAQPDGMTCQMDEHGNYVLLRNHELFDRAWTSKLPEYASGLPERNAPTGRAYNGDMLGGVSRLVIDPNALADGLESGDGRNAVRHSNLVLTGTAFNCSGGAVPGGWVSCEETDHPKHGYAFMTLATDTDLVDPIERRITSWGRFKREGVTAHLDAGVVYMTEDHAKGCFYRFIPADPEVLTGPGEVQALKAVGVADSDPTEPHSQGASWAVEWITIDDPQAGQLPCREQAQANGATRFNRCEGSTLADGHLWFIASTAGPVGAGQVFRYDPASERLHLEVQVTNRAVLSMPDNVTTTPWGDVLMTEDNYNVGGGATHQYVRGLRPDGTIYDFGRNPVNGPDDCGAELTGPCFSPDGRYLFLNIQSPLGLTVVIEGPWPRVS